MKQQLDWIYDIYIRDQIKTTSKESYTEKYKPWLHESTQKSQNSSNL